VGAFADGQPTIDAMAPRTTRFEISPRVYRHVTLVAALLIAAIIVTGGAVRLTDSGLGCPSWPNCSPGRLTPRSASDVNELIEFVNRLFTGLVSLGVIAAVLGSLLRRPRRRDLVWLSLGLVAGVLAQIVLGGITVLVDLHPVAVMSHFLLSMVLLADAVVLFHRAGVADPGGEQPVVERRVLASGWGLLCLAAVVVVTGTVVTNTGPHAGDEEAKRFGFALPEVARVHGTSVVVFLLAILAVGVVAYRLGAFTRLQRAFTVLLVVVVAQGIVGYVQYFNGVPALLVGVHLAGAAAVFTATLAFLLAMFAPAPAPEAAARAARAARRRAGAARPQPAGERA
jgi:cytochrome c oxidase assembly protein subunit 15